MKNPPRHVLDGYKVLDFTQYIAGPTVTRTIANGENTTWTAFLHGNGPQPFDPANARVFFEFIDSTGVVRGSTSAAVTVQ